MIYANLLPIIKVTNKLRKLVIYFLSCLYRSLLLLKFANPLFESDLCGFLISLYVHEYILCIFHISLGYE